MRAFCVAGSGYLDAIGRAAGINNLGAINAMYDWAASRYGSANPVVRRQLMIRGLDRDSQEVALPRGRTSQRDCAFADDLYGIGLSPNETADLDPSSGCGHACSDVWTAAMVSFLWHSRMNGVAAVGDEAFSSTRSEIAAVSRWDRHTPPTHTWCRSTPLRPQTCAGTRNRRPEDDVGAAVAVQVSAQVVGAL